MMTEKDRVVSAYEAQKGDCILHQIAAKNQGDGSGRRVFERFIDYNKGRDIVLSVRSLNTRAIEFYKKYGFIKVSDIEWGKTKQVKGEVYLLEQKPLYRYKENKFV
jgi:ribosomal protein S18 acetylase RimI-like enzyme